MKRIRIILSAVLLSLACHASKPPSTENTNRQVILDDVTFNWDESYISFTYDGYYPLSEYAEAEYAINDLLVQTYRLQNAHAYVERYSNSEVYVGIELFHWNYGSQDKVFHIECDLFKFTITQEGMVVNDISMTPSGSLAQGNAMITLTGTQDTPVYYNILCNGIFMQQVSRWTPAVPVTQEGIYTIEAIVYDWDHPDWNEITGVMPIAQGPLPMPGFLAFFYNAPPLMGGNISGAVEYYSGIDSSVTINSTSAAFGGITFWNYAYSWEILTNSTWTTLPGETGVNCTINVNGLSQDIHVRRKVVRGDETAYSNTHLIRRLQGSNQAVLDNRTFLWNQTAITFTYDGYYPLSGYAASQNAIVQLFAMHGLTNARVRVERLSGNNKKVYVEIDLGQSNHGTGDKVFNLQCSLFKFVLTQKGLVIGDVSLSKSGSLTAGNATLILSNTEPTTHYNLFCNGTFVRQVTGSTTSIPVSQQGYYTLEAVVYDPNLPGNSLVKGPVSISGNVSFFYDAPPLAGGNISGITAYYPGTDSSVTMNSESAAFGGITFWDYVYSWEILTNSTWTTLPGETGVNCTINVNGLSQDIHVRRKVVRGEETAYSNTHIIRSSQVVLDDMTLAWDESHISFTYDGYYPLSEYAEAEYAINDLLVQTYRLPHAHAYVERLTGNDRKVFVEIDLFHWNYGAQDKIIHLECSLFKVAITRKGMVVNDVSMSKSGSLNRGNAAITLINLQQSVYYNVLCNGVFVEQVPASPQIPVTQEGTYTLEAVVYDLDDPDWNQLDWPAPLVQGPVPMSGSVTIHPDDTEVMENPVAAISAAQNYITHFVSHDGSTSSGSLTAQYYDGLGRPNETVQFAASPTKKDMVSYQEYDASGRESKAWLPIAVSGNNGAYLDFNQFRTNVTKASVYTDVNEREPYAFPVYEASPLNRVTEQYGAGSDWHTNKRSVRTAYLANITGNDTLNCIRYTATDHATIDTVMTINRTGNYASNQLYVTRTTDEDGNVSFEFKNKLGQVILTRQLNGADKECHDTYRIYDDFGNLKAVLPPIAADAMKTGSSWTSSTNATLKDYTYLYRYDAANRCVMKKLPGTGAMRYVYDKANRVIFTQDAKKQWSFSIPDVFGRVVITGTFNTINESANILNSDYANSLVIANFDVDGPHNYYTIKKDGSTLTIGAPSYLITNYYDKYDFMSQSGFSGLVYALPTGADARFNTRDTDASTAQTLLTGSITGDAAGGTTRIYTAMYYDYRGRMIQSRSTNHLGGTTTDCLAYGFTGKTERKLHIHKQTGSSPELKELYTYTYDHAERLMTTTHQLNDGAVVTLAENFYDDQGRLKTKKRHGNTANRVAYTYNIRNWLTKINNSRLTQNLYYNTGLGTPRYNGNISSMTWKAGTETALRGYTFMYDNLNRLTEAGYGEGATLASNTGRYTEKVTGYDKHGNITGLQRYGKTTPYSYGLIDNLTFGYTGNRMQYVDDVVTTNLPAGTFHFANGSNSTASEYLYDANGNMKQDLNKGISHIAYNFLNLPKQVQFSTGGVATHVYDAAGVKRSVSHQGAGENKTTDYCGNVIYENGALSKILIEEGYITLSGTTPTYHYYLKDHLGNNRVVMDQNGTIEQVNHYYPFGGLFDQTAEDLQRYKFGNKELDRTCGLDLYDYSARYMDGALGRFTTMDPMAEKYYSISPYAYCANNPIRYTDPTGMVIGDPPGFWESFGSGFSRPFVNFGYAVSHPVETVKSVARSFENATPFEIGLGISEQLLRSPMSLVSGLLNQMDVAGAVAYDNVNGTLTSAEVVGNQWGNIAFDATTTAVGAGVGKAAGMVGNVVGKTTKATQTATAIKEGTQVLKPVHGNSLQSVRPTWGYKLYSNDGTFLKNGITSKPIPQQRYTKTFMQTHDMKPIQLFSNRRAAWNWEYQQNLIQKGPLNKNMH